MDDIERVLLPDLPTSSFDRSTLSDEAAMAEAVRWIAERYVMSDAFAGIMLSQLARQDGLSEAAAARNVLVTAVIGAAKPASLP